VKPILITGATGFLGQYVVELLRGRPLRLLARGKTRWDADASIEVLRGDVTNARDVERAVARCIGFMPIPHCWCARPR
jgi:nucleoside-diphosphate-sugar epimerase